MEPNFEELSRYANFFGIEESDFLTEIGVLKKADDGKKNPGVAVPLKGLLDNYMRLYDARGVKSQFAYIPDYKLRSVVERDPIINIVINTRMRQLRAFAKPQKDVNKPGYRIRLKEEEKNPTKKDRLYMAQLEEFMYNSGRNDFDESVEREDNILDVMTKAAREYYTIDKVAIELRRDQKNNILDFWILDGATIKRVVPGGYRGHKTDFDPRSYIFNDEFLEKIAEAKLENLPELEEVSFVQEVDGKLVAAFTNKDLLMDFMNKRVDVRYAGYGYSNTEQAIGIITSFLFALAYNTEAFNGSVIPKIGLAFENGEFSTDQLADLQDQWLANFNGVGGAWRIPMLNGKVNVLDFMKSPRDMEYQKFLEFTASVTGAVFGFDLMEAGLKFFSSTNVLNENQDGRMQFSKDRGLIDLLGTLENLFNKILRVSGMPTDYYFEFTGLDPIDREFEQKNKTERVKSYMTVDEIRAESELSPLPDGKGDIILDSIFMQNVQGKQMADMEDEGAEEEDFNFDDMESQEDEGSPEDDIESVIDETMDELNIEKAKLKARTFLL